MKDPVFGHNKLQSYIQFETNESIVRLGLEGTKLFVEKQEIKTELGSASGESESGNVTTQYVTLSNDGSIYRMGVRNGLLVIDKTLTLNGFDGTEGLDWEQITNIE